MDGDTLCSVVDELLVAYHDEEPEFPLVSIVRKGIKQDAGWWYGPVVRPIPHTLRAHPYYDHLREVEARVRDRCGVDVLLVPARAA